MKLKFICSLLLTLLFISGTAQVRRSDKSSKNNQLDKVTKEPLKGNTQIFNSTETIQLEDITEWLCPKALLRGDREFDRHGPRIKSEVTLRIGEDNKTIWADIYFWAQETVHDFSTTEGRWSKKVYDAPYGKTIKKIVSDKASRTTFISKPAGFQLLIPGKDIQSSMNAFFDGGTIANAVLAAHGIPSPTLASQNKIASLISTYSHGNTVMQVPATEGTLVKFFHIVGDTGGPDISTDDNCNDDTRIEKIEFFPVKVEFGIDKN